MNMKLYYNADAGGGSGPAAEAPPPTEAAPAPAAPWSWAREDGALNEGWLERLPGDLKGHASLKAIGSLPDLAKSYVETKAMVGKRLEAPGANATPAQVAAWRKAVGAPEQIEGYFGAAGTLRPEIVPETMWDAENEKKFAALAHKHHLSTAAVQEILGFYGQNVAQTVQATQAQEAALLQSETASLRQAWGADFDQQMHLAARAAQTVGLDPKSHPIFTNADVVQAFARMGRLMSEDRLVRGETPGVGGSISDRIRDITDPASTSVLAREYRGDFGAEPQAAAQAHLHQLLASPRG